MSKKPVSSANDNFSRLLSRGVMACGIVVLIGGGVLLEGQAERYLMRDPRFQLQRAEDYGDPPPDIHVEGVRNLQKDVVLKAFEPDLGRSVFLLPLEKRRLELLGYAWVKDAAISRLWPNQISVRVTERKPIAFVKREGGADTTVIDGEGVLMEAPPAVVFSLPVVAGVGPDVEQDARRYRMHRVERLIKDLGPDIKNIGEINASDSENLTIVQPFRNRAVTLILGNRNFQMRYKNFLGMADQLLEKLPNAVSFDLRLEEQVTAKEY
jgi:cell division protein FtsQ